VALFPPQIIVFAWEGVLASERGLATLPNGATMMPLGSKTTMEDPNRTSSSVYAELILLGGLLGVS